MAKNESSEWRRFVVALGATVVVLTLLVVAFGLAQFKRANDNSSAASTTTISSRASYTQNERRFLTELDIEGLLDPDYSIDESLKMGYELCGMMDQMSSSSPAKDVADYLFEYQTMEQLESRSSYEDIFTVVALANYHLCPY
ncbi:DUF732 domain-containing protein [Rhodococcus pyridinivorans]